MTNCRKKFRGSFLLLHICPIILFLGSLFGSVVKHGKGKSKYRGPKAGRTYKFSALNFKLIYENYKLNQLLKAISSSFKNIAQPRRSEKVALHCASGLIYFSNMYDPSHYSSTKEIRERKKCSNRFSVDSASVNYT